LLRLIIFTERKNTKMENSNLLLSKSDDFRDMVLTINEVKLDFFNDYEILAGGNYEGLDAEVKIIIKNNLKPGIDQGKIKGELTTKGGVQFKSTGNKSDVFVSALSYYYGLGGKQKFTIRSVVTSCLAMCSEDFDITKDKVKFLLSFDSEKKMNLFGEMYMDIDFEGKKIILAEKDQHYRSNILSNFTI
jgi:hypothetical protein